jgi:hypothetical protein
MANEMTDALALRLLDLGNGVTTAAPVTGPLKLAALTVQGTDTTAGTEVTGGTYARQTITLGAAALVGGVPQASNTNAITFSGLPAIPGGIVGYAIYDSAGTPLRCWELPRTGGATSAIQAGDSNTIAIGGIVVQLD